VGAGGVASLLRVVSRWVSGQAGGCMGWAELGWSGLFFGFEGCFVGRADCLAVAALPPRQQQPPAACSPFPAHRNCSVRCLSCHRPAGNDFFSSISRARFEELCMDLFQKCMEPVVGAALCCAALCMPWVMCKW
jgi:hypothetical protein